MEGAPGREDAVAGSSGEALGFGKGNQGSGVRKGGCVDAGGKGMCGIRTARSVREGGCVEGWF